MFVRMPVRSGLIVAVAILLPAGKAGADDIPACALSGSVSVMIAGKPALRMADVVHCPPELIEIIPGIQIEGQPMVHIRQGIADDTACTTTESGTVSAGKVNAQGLGDVACKSGS